MQLDVLPLAERKVDSALSTLGQALKMVDMEGGISPTIATVLHKALLERSTKTVKYLSGMVREPSVRGAELRTAMAALNKVVRLYVNKPVAIVYRIRGGNGALIKLSF